MPQTKSKIDARSKISLLQFDGGANGNSVQAEELLHEIDNLALLLHEVKKQTDKIEAAADAIGDAILTRLSAERTPLTPSRAPRRSRLPMQSKATGRVRALPPRDSQMHDAQP